MKPAGSTWGSPCRGPGGAPWSSRWEDQDSPADHEGAQSILYTSRSISFPALAISCRNDTVYLTNNFTTEAIKQLKLTVFPPFNLVFFLACFRPLLFA